MGRVKRRHFLQLAASTLATFGWSENRFWRVGNNIGKVLATATPRKLALLVGINQYDRISQGWIPLQGCLTDIQMQKELLVNCFGFLPQDIYLLSDRDATRENILAAFEEHLIKQAKPEDVVVFHYSGHGSRVSDPDSMDGVSGTIVPIDSPYPESEGQKVRDILGSTLFLLTSALPTDRTTMILDCCYAGGTTRGNLRVRSRSGSKCLQVLEIEKEYQKNWSRKLNISPQEFQQRRQRGIANGVAITSARKNQLAADIFFDGFAAGAFTYALTQYLWQKSGDLWLAPTIERTKNAIATIVPNSLQEPMLEIAPQLARSEHRAYFLDKQLPPAEAVITNVDRNLVELWLGGIDPGSISALNRGATFSVLDRQQNTIATVELDSRNGLVGRGRLISSTQKNSLKGSLLRDEIHSIPTDFALKIGVDDRDASFWQETVAAFSSWKHLKVLPLQQEEIDCIFGRVTPEIKKSQSRVMQPLNSLGLFYSDLTPMPNSFYIGNESILSAIQRLKGRIQSLIAIELIRLTFNPNSSRLKIAASLQHPDKSQPTVVATSRDRETIPNKIEQIPPDFPLQLAIVNQENSLLYVSVLAIDSEGQIVVIFPNQWNDTIKQTAIAPQETILIPESPASGFELRSAEPFGITEILVVASTTSFKNSLLKLEQIAQRNKIRNGAMALSDPWEAIENLVSDIDFNTRGASVTDNTEPKPYYLVDTSQLAILSLSFEVVAPSK